MLCTTACGGLLVAMPVVRSQQAGNVDPSFGVSLGLAGNVSLAVPQPDGKVLVIGSEAGGLLRLNADGSLDGGFHADPAAMTGAVAIALQPDGKIIVGTGIHLGHAAVRLNTDGSLDASFSTIFPRNTTVSAILVQPDGKIVLGGYFNHLQDVFRVNADGSADATFAPPQETRYVSSMVLQPDGKILVGAVPDSDG